MVERVWSARAANRDNAVAYASYFRRVVLPELKAVSGYRGAKVLQREGDDGVEIVVVSRWESLDAIRGFAGDDIDHAVVHDEAARLLAGYDRTARHFEIVSEDR
jgi:heme-degrading monooxygenase HmoA